jgi:hypothetical protein
VPREQHAPALGLATLPVVGLITASVGCWLVNARSGKSVRTLPTDMQLPHLQVRFVPILLQKSFWDDDRNFLGPLMRFV